MNESNPPSLPEVDSPPAEDVLDGVPSPEEIIEHAESAEQIVEQQPSVEELLPQAAPTPPPASTEENPES